MVIDFNKGNGGGGSGYTLPIASEQQLGGIKVGSGLSITTAGTLSADAQPVGVATTASTGIVQVGSGLSITSGGVLSADGVDLTNYVQEQELSGYQTTQAMSAYQTTQGMSGYVETSAMSGYATTDSLSAYTPSSAMSDYLTVSDYHYDVDDVLEQNIKTLYGDDAAVGMAYLWNDGGSEKAKVFKVTDSGTSVDDYTYYQPSRNTKAPQPEGWVVDKSEQIATIDNTNWGNPTIATKSDVAKFGYVDEEEGVANFLVSYDQQLWQQTFTREYDPEEGEDVWVDGGVQPIGGIEKASFTNWGTLKLANGIALEVNDSDEGQGVVLGVSAGENVVWGNGVGEAENNAKGLRAPVQSYTQYDLDIYDDHENSICVVDSGLGRIDFKNFVLGSDGTYFYLTNNGDSFIRIYVDEGVPYVECPIDGGSESCEIQFQNDGDYKDFRLEIDGTVLQVFEPYDNYENIIAEIENAAFIEGYNHIQLFDKDYNMESGAIGTIIFNNTDFIKPYYDYSGDSVQNVGFVLKKRSYTNSL